MMDFIKNIFGNIFTNNKVSIFCLIAFVLAVFGETAGYDTFCRHQDGEKCWVEDFIPSSEAK